VKDLLFLGMGGVSGLGYVVTRALASPYRDRVSVLYVEDFVKDGAIELKSGGEPVLRWNGQEVRFADIRACYNLLMSLPRKAVEDGVIREEDWHPYRSRLTGLVLVLQRTASLVINRPLLDAGNGSKPLQTARLARYGFRVPRTLTTNSPEKALAFAESLGWRVIYKSSSNRASLVKRLTPDRRADLQRIRSCPVLLQEQIEGPDVRAHVVGGEVFAERIEFSGGIDVRYVSRAQRQFIRTELPEAVRERAVRFVAESGLGIVGFDFKVCPKTGEFVALEANSQPGYHGYDLRLGGVITDALLRRMAEGPIASGEVGASWEADVALCVPY
jgi:glutathione synthase/RimK-type ligase-like ATP-grasp enzyme